MYRATNVSLGRKVAIKLLSAEFVHIEEDVLRFLREARAAAAVRHTNVVDVLDVARDDDGTPFIVQELLAGEDLEQHLIARGGRLSYEEALEIMIPVADAVAAAHAHDVVHRDLKPANIFLSRDRNKLTPKVLDFGACLFPTIAERSAKEIRMLIGTPHYMAPEQIVSKAEVDARSDVWALGIILYEMIVGETPFEAETANAVMQLVKTREVPLLRERMKDAPAELEELIAQCTKRDRLARLPNAAAVHERMEMVQRHVRRVASAGSRADIDIGGQPAPVSTPPRSTADPSPPKKSGLLTLNSPSEPPVTDNDLDLDLPFPPPSNGPRRRSAPPVSARGEASSAQWPNRSVPDGGLSAGRMRELDTDESVSAKPLHLAARPSSWPPPANRPSSIPPVLDPRAAARPSFSNVSLPLPEGGGGGDRRTSASLPAPTASRAPAAAITKPLASSREQAWSPRENARFGAAIALPAVIGWVAVLVIPALGTPIGHALRGDSTLASGVLAVLVLVSAAALCARSLLGERDRWVAVAAVGSVLFAIVMIIVTFSASEAAELGVPSTMTGLSSLIAPIAPVALAARALGRARAQWLDHSSRGEAFRFAAFASVMLFLSLALSPLGAVRTASRPPQASRNLVGN